MDNLLSVESPLDSILLIVDDGDATANFFPVDSLALTYVAIQAY